MVRWNGEEQALHVLLDLVKKYIKAQKLSRKNVCNLFFITRFSKIVLWLPTTSIHADLVLSLRVGKNQEQQDSSETLWSDSDDEVVQ